MVLSCFQSRFGMPLRGLLITAAALLACCATALAPRCARAATTDAVFVSSTPQGGESAREKAPYDSEYAAAARDMGNGFSTPEADARPGEYYFLLAAHAFRKNDFAFAIQMYEVAASWAFKPAQYNLAIMYARGQGVPVDLPRGMAWMALAAERDDKRYVDAREAIYAEMSKEQFDQANMIWRDLKKTYGDEVALRRAKARWAQVKASMTGSRVGSVGNMTVGIPNAGSGDPSFSRIANAQVKKNMEKQGMVMARSSATSPAEATGGEGVDASIAYRQLRESDNPYDPKFKTLPIGHATVGEPTAVKAAESADPSVPGLPDPDKHD